MSGGRRAAEPHSGKEAGKPARHARAEAGADGGASAEAVAASEAHGAGAPAGERPAPAAAPASPAPTRRRPRVGVVAVQGAFAEHVRQLRRLGSFHAEGTWEGGGAFPDDPSAADAATDDRVASAAPVPAPLTFIRAPRIERLGPGARPLVTLGGQVVAVQQDAQLAAAFHPELDGDDRLYRRFLELMR